MKSIHPELNQILDMCPSTNTWLASFARSHPASDVPHGAWISTRQQPEGKGRQGRSWISGEGNLFLSVVIRDLPRGRWSWLPITTALATRHAIDRLGSRADTESIQIKWPNDLVVRDTNVRAGYAKVGGILVEAFIQETHPFLIVGIGVNVATAPVLALPTAQMPAFPARSLQELGLRASVDTLRTEVVRALLTEVNTLATQGPQMDAIQARLFFAPGARIGWTDGVQETTAQVRGLGPHGELIVELPDRTTQTLLSEDIHCV